MGHREGQHICVGQTPLQDKPLCPWGESKMRKPWRTAAVWSVAPGRVSPKASVQQGHSQARLWLRSGWCPRQQRGEAGGLHSNRHRDGSPWQ